MKMSCNGCRVLRKGCSEDCCLRPSLQWINSADSQANATVFLAKFYGRAGLINLINAGPDNLRASTFRSLLYEACGRVVNPIYGSAGLMFSGDWQRCQEAVDAVLAGTPIMQMTNNDAAAEEKQPITPLKGGDIRHLFKGSTANGVHRVRNNRNRFKRFRNSSAAGEHPKNNKQVRDDNCAAPQPAPAQPPMKFSITGWNADQNDELNRAPSHDSGSVETMEPSLMNLANEAGRGVKSETGMDVVEDDAELLLDLTLGLSPVQKQHLAADGDV